ncbi:MAG TPA: M20/M25/M40 family metallo-hydrolase [Candidatus Eisenbacteria bacterium]|jgi:acetylornithine deacetylase/succinyl-diaminopimelate desuccinylase-like protein
MRCLRERRSIAIATALAALLLPSPAPSATREPNWPRAVAEYRQVLGDLIAIDTSNPPGRELEVARYLDSLLAREGIRGQTFETAPGRGNFVARLSGSGRKPPLLLLGHMDVVGVERDRWSGDPFRLEERDGFLYGRGVIDDKGMVAAEAMTLILLKRLGVPLERDVVFLAECDEESGGEFGVGWMLEHHRDAIDAELAINEGGRTLLDDAGRIAWVGVQNSEKRSINYTLTASGVSGHASMPRADNCILSLSRAIQRAADPPFPVTLTPATRAFFRAIAPSQPPALRTAMESLDDPAGAGAASEALAADLMFNAMLRNTVSPTIVNGGFRANVIPASATATLNCRLLPGTDPEAFRRALEERIADPRVQVSFTPPTRPEAPSMPFEGAVVEAARRAAKPLAPEAAVVPLLSTGATDSAQLRGAGIRAYGLLPFPLTTEDAARMHGNDERMPVASLGIGLRLLYGVTAAVASR